jgi:hypothetical protein
MTTHPSRRISDEAIRVAGTVVGLAIIGLGFLLALTVSPGPAEESWFWRTAGLSLPFVTPGLLVLAITARIVGASRAWVLPVTAGLFVAFLALAVHAADVATISGRFDTGWWGFLYVAGPSASSLGLLFVLGSGERKAAYMGLVAALVVAASGIALALHEAAQSSFWADGWVFLGEVDSHLSSAVVLAAACLVSLRIVPRPLLRMAGMVAATAVLATGIAYGWWFMERVQVDRGWFLSLEWTRAVSLAVLVLVATDVIRRFDLMTVLVAGLMVASAVNAIWFAWRTEAREAEAFLYIALSFLTPVALIVFLWLLNDREREPDEAPRETLPPRLDSLGYGGAETGAV